MEHRHLPGKYKVSFIKLVGNFYARVIVLSLFVSSCNIPMDSRNSLEIAQDSVLKVGAVNNPPYSMVEKGVFSGTEVALIRSFAKEKKLDLKFITASESVLIEMLKTAELHIMIGGFDKKTIWQEHAGLTSPYDENHVMLVPKGENRLVYELESFFNTLKE